MKPEKSIWVLQDNRMGNTTQTIGCADALNLPYEIKKISYTKLGGLPNILKGASLIGIDDESKKNITHPFPDLVISAGRKLACVARYIKKHSPKTKLVHIMNPGFIGSNDFDIIVLPKHDKIFLPRQNIKRIETSAHTMTIEKLAEAKKQWQDKLSNFPRPFTSVFIGGSTKDRQFTPNMAQELGRLITKITKESGGTALITTSRRTGDNQEKILKESITTPCFFYSWNDEGDNPYFAFMANANNIIVTADSINMVSESISLQIPVYIYNHPDFIGKKHKRFIQSLIENRTILTLKNSTKIDFQQEHNLQSPLKNSADIIAKEINKILAI